MTEPVTARRPVPRTSSAPPPGTPPAAGLPPAEAEPHDDHRARTAVRGAFLGSIVDNFDIYLPVVVLAPALPYFLPDDLSPSTVAVITSWIFASTLVGRPLGALVFGWLSDTIGRRRSTILAVSGFAVTTLLIACLPGYATWGIGSVVLLVALRALDGVFLGGEYTGAAPLAMESVRPSARGRLSGLILSGGPFAWVAIGLLTLLVLVIAPAGGSDSAYARWGWRIPFLVGAALAVGLALYFRREVQESPEFERERAARPAGTRVASPLVTLLSGENRRSFVQVFVMMTGMWMVLNTVTAMSPATLAGVNGLSSPQLITALVAMFAVAGCVAIAGGQLSQVVGRRRYLVGSLALTGTLGAAAYAMLIASGPVGMGVRVMVLLVITGSLVVAPWGAVVAYINERFSTAARGSGFGLGYSLGVVLPAFFATYQIWLGRVMDPSYTVVVLLVAGAALAIVGALAGPETSRLDLGALGHDRPQEAGASASHPAG